MRAQPLWAVAVAAVLFAGMQHSDAKKSDRHKSSPETSTAPATASPNAPTPMPPTKPSLQAPRPTGQGASSPVETPRNPPSAEPSAVVVDKQEVQTILGKSVRSSASEDMGRLVDVIVDRDGQSRAAIIDFGGFLGVGSRKIAVDWKALQFSPDDPKGNSITLALTRDQVKAAPEYKDGGPIVILAGSGSLQPMPFTHPQAQEK